MGRQFIITFQLQLNNFTCGPGEAYCSVIHFTLGENVEVYGDRTPAVWISDGGNFVKMSSAINGNKDFKFDTSTASLGFELNRFYNFEFSQLWVENEVLKDLVFNDFLI